ncbi:MAG: hypothetical protein GY940_43520 [bacterium]|nr:hypothetical protein [bacterium]
MPRKEAVLALGKLSLTPFIALFISFLKQAALDKHSKVRAAALSLLGNRRIEPGMRAVEAG